MKVKGMTKMAVRIGGRAGNILLKDSCTISIVV